MATITDPPSSLMDALEDYVLTPHDNMGELRSLYSFVEGQIDFGGEWWTLSLRTTPLDRSSALAIAGWADRLRRHGYVARMPPAIGRARWGTSVVDAITAAATTGALSRSLAVNGLGSTLTLGMGSYISINDRLHRLMATVTGPSDTLTLFPRLREQVAGGASIDVGSAARGLWRLQGRPPFAESADLPTDYAEPMTLTFVEAIAP